MTLTTPSPYYRSVLEKLVKKENRDTQRVLQTIFCQIKYKIAFKLILFWFTLEFEGIQTRKTVAKGQKTPK